MLNGDARKSELEGAGPGAGPPSGMSVNLSKLTKHMVLSRPGWEIVIGCHNRFNTPGSSYHLASASFHTSISSPLHSLTSYNSTTPPGKLPSVKNACYRLLHTSQCKAQDSRLPLPH